MTSVRLSFLSFLISEFQACDVPMLHGFFVGMGPRTGEVAGRQREAVRDEEGEEGVGIVSGLTMGEDLMEGGFAEVVVGAVTVGG